MPNLGTSFFHSERQNGAISGNKVPKRRVLTQSVDLFVTTYARTQQSLLFWMILTTNLNRGHSVAAAFFGCVKSGVGFCEEFFPERHLGFFCGDTHGDRHWNFCSLKHKGV